MRLRMPEPRVDRHRPMARLILLLALVSSLFGCAGQQPVPLPTFSSQLPGNVLAQPEAMEMARLASKLMPHALQRVGDKLSYTPQRYTVLVCPAACFEQLVPVPGAAAAQRGQKIYVNSDMVVSADMESVLVHELAHLAISEGRGADFHKVPGWANEAIAVWASGVGTQGCDQSNAHLLCKAQRVSAWLDRLGLSDPQAQRCWIAYMVSGTSLCAAPQLITPDSLAGISPIPLQ